jgi:nitric oxide synthase-interacting protein
VSQKSDIKRQKDKLETMKKTAEDEKQRAKEAARERVLLDFEKSQLALAARPSTGAAGTTPGQDSNEGEFFCLIRSPLFSDIPMLCL